MAPRSGTAPFGADAERPAGGAGAVLAALVVAIAAAAPFLPALGQGYLAWDDAATLVDNPRVRGLTPENVAWMFTTFHKGPYQPLSWLSYGLEHEIHGLDPGLCHLTNVLLHAANAVLVFALARALARARGVPGGEALFAATAAALVFGPHPLRVESVAWATERRDVLSGLFLLGATLLHLRSVESGRGRDRAGAAVAFALSLLAKASGLLWPVALLVLDALVPRRAAAGAKGLLAEKIPLFLLAAGAAALAIAGQRSAGAMEGLSTHGVAERAAQCGYGLFFYAAATAFPIGLSALHEMPRGHVALDPAVLAGGLAALAVAALVFRFRKRAPALAAALLAYAVLVSPVLGAAQSGNQIVATRYSYLPCVPLALLAGFSLARWRARLGARAVVPALAAATLALGVLAFQTTRLWASDLRLWERAIRLDAENSVARYNRGLARRLAGDVGGAVADFSEAIRLRPRWPSPLMNRGNARLESGDTAGAIEDYSAVIGLGSGSLARAYAYRAAARAREGELEGALADIEAALRIEPGEPDFEASAAMLREALGR